MSLLEIGCQYHPKSEIMLIFSAVTLNKIVLVVAINPSSLSKTMFYKNAHTNDLLFKSRNSNQNSSK